MARALQYPQEMRAERWRTALAGLLSVAAAQLDAAAARLATRGRRSRIDVRREVEAIDVDGRRYGAIYEDGVLIGLAEVERL